MSRTISWIPARVRRVLYYLVWGLFAAVAVLGWPVQFGGDTGYTIVSGHSMDPTYHTGDLLITRAQDDYEIGDNVVYTVPDGQPAAGFNVVHRIVGGSGEPGGPGWTTRGDNNPSDDIWTPHNSDINGKVVINVGKGGFVLAQTRNPLLYAALGALVIGRLLWPTKQDADKNAETPDDQAPAVALADAVDGDRRGPTHTQQLAPSTSRN